MNMATQRTRLLVEGWRGINHSIAMVNQHQLLAWSRAPGLSLFHQDAPLFLPHWNPATHGAGFDAADTQTIANIPAPDGQPMDAVFRIHSPTTPPTTPPTTRADSAHQLTYVVTEFGLSAKSFAGPVPDPTVFTGVGRSVVTPTQWSRQRLLDFGLAGEHVHVVTHGVQLRTFTPSNPAQRQAERAALGYGDEHFVLVNVGVATWNKGIDLLIVAFARLRQRFAHARLILKDHRSLYGVSVDQVFKTLHSTHPGLLTADVLASIAVIATNLTQVQLRALYNVADCYVSPYRAEGFNLPVAEAMACGTPAVVTAGGATDDFCMGPWATRVAGREGRTPDVQLPGGRYIEADADALLHAITQRLEAPSAAMRLTGAAWTHWRQGMDWEPAAHAVLDLCLQRSVAVQPMAEAA